MRIRNVTLGNAPVSIYPVWKWSQRRGNFIFATRTTTEHDAIKINWGSAQSEKRKSLAGTKNSKWAWMRNRQTERDGLQTVGVELRRVDYLSCLVAIEFRHHHAQSQSLLALPLCQNSRRYLRWSLAYILTVTPNICSTLNDYKKIVEAIFTKHNIPNSSNSKRCLWPHSPPFPPHPLLILPSATTHTHTRANVSLMRRQHFAFA